MARILAVCMILFAQFCIADEYLVRIKEFPMSTESFLQKIEAEGIFIEKTYELVPGLLRISAREKTAMSMQLWPEVAYVEKNNIRKPQIISRLENTTEKPRPAIPPFVARPIDWNKNSGDTRNFGLWQNLTKDVFSKRHFYGSEKIIIAVLDTGVDYTHRDLAANLWRNPGESGPDASGRSKEANGIDDDNNGFTDDVVGWDFYHNDNLPYDDYGHGTHVAGIAAAVGGDGWGISGHCARCSIMSLKFISKDGSGTDADAIEGLEYAAKMGATIINSSWGGDEYSQALYDAFAATSRLGIINAVAAGNSGVDLAREVPDSYPAEYRLPGLFAVSALYEINISMPFWSNYGRPFSYFSMGGAEVFSTIPEGRHASMSGTSMASPGAAGIFGLIKSYRPGISFEQLNLVLKKSMIGDKDSISKTNFGGRPNMMKLFQLLDALPE